MYYKVKVNLNNGDSFFIKNRYGRDLKFDHPDIANAYLEKFGQIHLIKDNGMIRDPGTYKFEIKEYKGQFGIMDKKNLRLHLDYLLSFMKGMSV